MPVDPCFAPLLGGVAASPADPVAAARAATGSLFTHAAAPAVAMAERTIPGPAGPLPVRIYTPPAAGTAPVLVYFHGGGFIAGSAASHDGTVRELCNRTPAVVVSVDYRLAPEHRFPAAVEDCHAALLWAAANAAELGGDPHRLAIAGDSAGGNLAAAVALVNRDRHGPRLALQALVYPVIDPGCGSASAATNGRGYMLTTDSMRWMWSLYVNGPEDHDNPYAAPLNAATLAGLPPALVITAEFDPLRDEGEAYAKALAAAGVPVSVTRYDGMIHGFFSFHDLTPRAVEAADEVARALRRAWAA